MATKNSENSRIIEIILVIRNTEQGGAMHSRIKASRLILAFGCAIILQGGGLCVPKMGPENPFGEFCPTTDVEGPKDLVLKEPQGIFGSYVADTGNNRVLVLHPPPYDTFQIEKVWGEKGILPGQFLTPTDVTLVAESITTVALGISSFVFVVDSGNHRIQKFDRDGQFVLAWGGFGQGIGQFNTPMGIGVDKNDNIYVADSGNYRIQKFDRQGNYITQWGKFGTGNGEFVEPYDATGEGHDGIGNPYVYVTDKATNRVQKFTVDGVFVRSWTKFGGLQFSSPTGIDADDRYVMVADTGNNRIVWLDRDRNEYGSWDGANRKFLSPIGIVSGTVTLSVADTDNNRILACYGRY